MRLSRFAFGAVFLTMVVALAGCGDDDGGPTSPAEQVASVTVTPSTATVEALDATQQFDAEAQDADGNVVSDVDISWSSSDDGVATVDDAGLATAVGNGSATITATAGGESGTADLTVDQAVSTVEVTPGTETLTGVGATQTFAAEALDANGNPLATQPSFSWSSTDDAVATVNSSGLAVAQARGSVQISASADGQSGAADLTVEGILHWTDGNQGTSAVPGALDSLGVSATTASDSSDFVSLLQEGGWGLVVFGEQLNAVYAGSVQTELESYVNDDGGKLLATTWQDAPLATFLQATRTDTNYSDLITDDHQIFDGLPSSISVIDPGWGTYAGAYTADSDAECLGSTSVGDCGAILGHGNRTLLVGPLFDTYSNLAEGETLLAQAMEFLIDVSATSSSSAVVRSYEADVSGVEAGTNIPGGGR